ncbi:protein Aster-A [Carettochelys insculpta]|uniref:protein Aster-A n=1 Tax=Carettochelys insculpta TaxID=44489 RepID=UPI003EBB447E
MERGSPSPRSSPSSSPALRKHLPLPTRPPPEPSADAVVEKSTEGAPERGPLPAPLSYPLSSRTFIRNKKAQSWYSVLSPTYKQRNEDFRRIFKGLPESERLLVDYSCALQRDILLQGRLYLSENWLCFYSNIFRWETALSIPLREVKCLKKEKMARLIPNAIQVCTAADKHFFTSFGARDRCFMLIFRLWQNALLEKTLPPRELWHIVHQGYGSELGLTSEDDDYVCPAPADELNGLGPARELADLLELKDPALACTAHLSQEPSPSLDRTATTQSFHSLANSSDGAASLAEDVEEHVDNQADAATNCTAKPGLETPKAAALQRGDLPALGDLLPHEELPTDTSNNSSSSSSSSTQDEEADAFSDLSGRLLLNCVYHLGAEQLQQMLFSNSPFMQSFLSQRKFTGVTLTSWSGKSKCRQSRVISYTIPLSNPLGPKAAAVVETQTLFRASPDSNACVVDSEVITQGIPYQDYFYTAHRYYISTLATGTTRIRVSSEIRYRKQPWPLVRALIEKNAWSGMEEYFQHLGLALARVEKTLLEDSGCRTEPRGLLTGLRHRKRTLSWRAPHAEPSLSTLPPSEAGPSPLRPTGSLVEQGRGPTMTTLILIVSLVLLVLVVLNVMLLYRLWVLEHMACAFQASSLARGKLPQTVGEWAKVLELQRRFHGAEVRKWRRILEASVELLDEMKVSLEKLHQGLAVAEPPPEPGQAEAVS